MFRGKQGLEEAVICCKKVIFDGKIHYQLYCLKIQCATRTLVESPLRGGESILA